MKTSGAAETRVGVAVVGHICVDMVPLDVSAVVPGRLHNVGELLWTGGGCCANTGIALSRLGTPVRIVAKVGPDHQGHVLLRILREQDAVLADNIIVSKRRQTSYSIVIQMAGADRSFLHHTGCNDTFKMENIPWDGIADCAIFHFGYPPLLKHIYQNADEMVAILLKAKELGMMTTMDMSLPDESSDGARIDWARWLEKVLPYVDGFLPSEAELKWFLRHEDVSSISEAASWCIQRGAGFVVVKCGDKGMHLYTSDGKELHCPVFPVQCVKGTTGAGDASIAGFLTYLAEAPIPSMEHLRFACAVGACSVEAVDSTSGIPSREIVEKRFGVVSKSD